VSWWRDWDKCERLAAALARRIEKDGAPLETVFNILKSRSAIRKVVLVLDDDKDTRPYLKALRKSLEASPGVGNREQHDALLEGW
jgi:hypoxanthine phosphoribosyltransferase